MPADCGGVECSSDMESLRWSRSVSDPDIECLSRLLRWAWAEEGGRGIGDFDGMGLGEGEFNRL